MYSEYTALEGRVFSETLKGARLEEWARDHRSVRRDSAQMLHRQARRTWGQGGTRSENESQVLS